MFRTNPKDLLRNFEQVEKDRKESISWNYFQTVSLFNSTLEITTRLYWLAFSFDIQRDSFLIIISRCGKQSCTFSIMTDYALISWFQDIYVPLPRDALVQSQGGFFYISLNPPIQSNRNSDKYYDFSEDFLRQAKNHPTNCVLNGYKA